MWANFLALCARSRHPFLNSFKFVTTIPRNSMVSWTFPRSGSDCFGWSTFGPVWFSWLLNHVINHSAWDKSQAEKKYYYYILCKFTKWQLFSFKMVLGKKRVNRCSNDIEVHSVAKVYAVLPFYDVKCLCSGGREWWREESHSH